MGSLLEEMHKMRLKEKIDELESMGGNPHVADHGLGGVYRCKVCGYIFDENKEGRQFPGCRETSEKEDHLQHFLIVQSVM